ncbi:DUF1649-domain-containing protein [Basidiobolus meristosporus CBS 931.73]|uniref:Autophagy-related protein 101 n=1 Tax=Basidiobolus meristosporus CBS 931.73 TaxID=1314790 RepID=A0A1Y1YCJ8_9FUNG|nr:DUF1649-domain-containing protein [Basidiobolus meristosporus CBS 931.73]|eukprot:ORX95334.1 DUF1649-domain-containing protein [Basidiobolus meristosporus CBS 931.73]
MTPEVFNFDLTVERLLLKDVLRAVLHSILFHRVFGNVRPREVDFMDLTYVAIEDAGIDKAVEEKIPAFLKTIDASRNQRGQLAVMFYEKRTRKAWFSKSEEEVCWEQWIITFTILRPNNERDRNQARMRTERQVADFLMDIVQIVNDRKDHIPPITNNDPNPFPFQITVPSVNDTWGSMFKRMLTDNSSSSGP